MAVRANTPKHERPGDAFRRPGTAGLILCGGRSSRMGADKARLRFPDGPLVLRVLRRVSEVAGPVVLSVAAKQALPPLPDGVERVQDTAQHRGPLWGLLEGFRRLAGRAERVLVLPVDVPLLPPAWMARLVDGLEGDPPYAACLYEFEGFANALTAAYRLNLLDKLEALVAESRMRPLFLSEGERTRIVQAEGDPEGPGGHPLMDIDTPEAYRRALLLEGVGEAEGMPVTVRVSISGSAEPPLPLQARRVEGIEVALRRLYPELAAAPLHLAKAPGGTALPADAGLAPDETLWATFTREDRP